MKEECHQSFRLVLNVLKMDFSKWLKDWYKVDTVLYNTIYLLLRTFTCHEAKVNIRVAMN